MPRLQTSATVGVTASQQAPLTPEQWLKSLSATVLKSYLNPTLVPKPKVKAPTIANVTTPAQAQLYAANGFHAALASKWAAPAAVYFTVYQDVKAGITNMTRLLTWLRYANKLSDEARAATGPSSIRERPPVPTTTGTTETPPPPVATTPPVVTETQPQTAGASDSTWPWVLGGGLAIGALVWWKKRKKK